MLSLYQQHWFWQDYGILCQIVFASDVKHSNRTWLFLLDIKVIDCTWVWFSKSVPSFNAICGKFLKKLRNFLSRWYVFSTLVWKDNRKKQPQTLKVSYEKLK